MRSLIRSRPRLRLAACTLAAALATLGALSGAVVASVPQTKALRYHGYKLVVPASWPVYDLAAAPTTCVRFNRHAGYLRTPSSRQRCPPRRPPPALARREAAGRRSRP